MHDPNSEIALLNFYRGSELHGGLILGQIARRATDARVIQALTRHSADELTHAQLLTETIVAIGGAPAPVRTTWQALYADAVGAPRTLLEVLAMTQFVERRVYRHFELHLGTTGIHSAVAATLRRISAEERSHVKWIRAWLEEQSRERRDEVRAVLGRYALADQRVNATLSSDYSRSWAA